MINYRVKNFKQADTRWGNLKYPVSPGRMATNGCGATATADIIASNYKYRKYTPKDSCAYMNKHGYSVVMNGKAYGTSYGANDGIKAILKDHGFAVSKPQEMSDFFKQMADGKRRRAVLLMDSGTRNGVTWTSSRHFVACAGYRVKDKKHYLYICDPGFRDNDGWFCYEDTMKGMVVALWTCYIPDEIHYGFDISYYQGKNDKATFQKAWNDWNDFVIIRCGYNKELKKDSTFEANYKGAIATKLKVGVYYYSTALTVAQAKAEAKFVLEILDKRKLTYPVFIDFEDASQDNLGKQFSKDVCEAFCNVIEKAGYQSGVYASYNYLKNKIAPIDKKYYVWLAQYPKATYSGRYEMHQYSSTQKIAGFGKIDADTSLWLAGTYPKAKTSDKKDDKKDDKKVVYPTLPKRGYFVKGDKGENVKRLQTVLNKYGFDCGKVDGILGDKTLGAIKKLQRKAGLKADGLFGKITLNALKKLAK